MIGGTIRIPDLAHNIGVPVTVHIPQLRIVPSGIIELDHHGIEFRDRMSAVKPDDPPLFQPPGFHGHLSLALHIGIGIFLLPCENIRVTILVEIGHPQ